jgi:hypothetical protein
MAFAAVRDVPRVCQGLNVHGPRTLKFSFKLLAHAIFRNRY